MICIHSLLIAWLPARARLSEELLTADLPLRVEPPYERVLIGEELARRLVRVVLVAVHDRCSSVQIAAPAVSASSAPILRQPESNPNARTR
jgi:hypothetical protein